MRLSVSEELPRLFQIAFKSREYFPVHTGMIGRDDDDDVYYSKGRRPREDEEGEESYEKRRQWPGRGG